MPESTRPVIVGIGELLWDMFPSGRQPGGAPANFVFHAGQLGAEAYPVSRVGDDQPGLDLLDLLSGNRLEISLISLDSAHPTGKVTVDLDNAGIPTFTIHKEVAWDYLAASSSLDEIARKCQAVCFGTLASRSPETRNTIRRFLKHTQPECLRVFDINIRQHFYTQELIEDMLGFASILKLNDDELPLLTDMFGIDGDERAAVETLCERFDLNLVALTRGGSGSLLFGPGGFDDHPGVNTDIADTVGAGDSFTAALTVGLLQGIPLPAINENANRVAAYVCSRPGGMPELPDDLRMLFRG